LGIAESCKQNTKQQGEVNFPHKSEFGSKRWLKHLLLWVTRYLFFLFSMIFFNENSFADNPKIVNIVEQIPGCCVFIGQ
jgi:hypothetical protein